MNNLSIHLFSLIEGAVAHSVTEHVTIQAFYPDHEPRENDIHYKYFNQVRAEMTKNGELICWRCGSKENIELHHNLIEFSLSNGVDIEKFKLLYPQFNITDNESFFRFVESKENILPLCMNCHRGNQGIHFINYPQWVIGRYWQQGLQPAAVIVRADAMVEE